VIVVKPMSGSVLDVTVFWIFQLHFTYRLSYCSHSSASETPRRFVSLL
jgi:hypothetical protein